MTRTAAVAAPLGVAVSPIALRIAGVVGLLVATLVAPAALLVWMPIVLGVPHLANDVRYLVLPLPSHQRIAAIVACTVLVGLRAASLVTGASLLGAEAIVVAMWLAVTVCMAPTSGWRLGVVVAAGAAIIALPVGFAAVAAMAHNAVAIIVWLGLARPGKRRALAVIGALLVATCVALAVGPALAAHTGGAATRWLTLDGAAAKLFPGMPLAAGRAMLVAFAFLQAVHYAIWLVWLPADRRPRRALPMAAIAVGTLVVIGAGVIDATWARTTYLALATFHIYLELVVLGARALRRRP